MVKKLIDQVVDLTCIRDVEMLESSLLSTVKQFLQPIELLIFTIDNNNTERYQSCFDSEGASSCNLAENIPDHIHAMIMQISSSDQIEHTIRIDEGYLSLYKLHTTISSTVYLQILNHDRLSREDRHLLLGVLNIFQNFIGLLGENITDHLTGLLNRKSFDQEMEKIYNRISNNTSVLHNERRKPVEDNYWLVMLDIDHFKKINDNFGHMYGDEVLILMAQIIRRSFRQEDLAFRFGGEEFVLIIQSQDKDRVRLVLQRLLENISNYLFPQVGRVTVSAGAVEIDRRVFSAILLDHADQALYYSKENGRNRLTLYSDLVESGVVQEHVVDSGEIEMF